MKMGRLGQISLFHVHCSSTPLPGLPVRELMPILAETYKSKVETYKSKAETYKSEAETYKSKLKPTIVS